MVLLLSIVCPQTLFMYLKRNNYAIFSAKCYKCIVESLKGSMNKFFASFMEFNFQVF